MFNATFPVIAIAIFGYIITNRSLLSQKEISSLSKFTFNYTIPILLFTSTAKSDIPENIEWSFLFSFYGAVSFIFILTTVLSKFQFKCPPSEQGVLAVSASYSNTTIVGIPICSYVLGDQSMLPLIIIISIQNLFIYSLGIIVSESENFSLRKIRNSLSKVVVQLFKSPISLSMIMGLLFNILDIKLPVPVNDSLDLFSSSAIPLAIFILGASLNKLNAGKNFTLTIYLVALKNIALPLVVYTLTFIIFEINHLLAATATIAAAMPTGISAYVFSEKYQVCSSQVASCILMSSLFSLISVNVIIMLL